jgi:hypothetical protein
VCEARERDFEDGMRYLRGKGKAEGNEMGEERRKADEAQSLPYIPFDC